MIYTTHYIQIAIQMVFNKQICMLIYVNQNNGEKMNCLKRNLNITNIKINIKHFINVKTNRPLIENPSTKKPGKKKPACFRTNENPELVTDVLKLECKKLAKISSAFSLMTLERISVS